MQLHWRTALTGRDRHNLGHADSSVAAHTDPAAARRAATPCVDDQGRCSARDTHGAPSTLT
jgi:hypothetical protein